jgi:hypothetical protein
VVDDSYRYIQYCFFDIYALHGNKWAKNIYRYGVKEMIKILEEIKCPKWIKYPKKYINLVQEEKHIFLPWYLTDQEDTFWRLEGIRKRYPERNLFPFSRRDCSDDIACWEKEMGEKVIVMHDFADPGWERRRVFKDFDAWYEWALTQEYEADSNIDGYSFSEIKIMKDLDE